MKRGIILAFVAMLLLSLTVSSALAEPEPSFGFKASQFFDGFNLFSIGSSYESFVRWNPTTNQCFYWTGILNSVSSVVVADSYCSLRTYTKEYKTIDTIDQQLLNELEGTSTTSDYSGGLGEIGDSCTTVADCGLVCEGRGDTCEPRCIDGGYGKICFAGEGTSTTGFLYSSTCGLDSDCAVGQECVAGICTLSEEDGAASGNPPIEEADGTTHYAITAEDICKTTDCTTKCIDGTPVYECSTKQQPKYCFKENDGTAVLKDYAGVCGCPEGERLDFEGLRCCNPDDNSCFNCLDGEIKTKACPDGSEVVSVTCNAGNWDPTGAVCPVKEPGFWNVTKLIILAMILAISTVIAGGAYYYSKA